MANERKSRHWLPVAGLAALLLAGCASIDSTTRQRQVASMLEFLFPGKQEPPKAVLPAKTDFSTVRMTGVVTDGVMRSDDLFAELPFMQLTGGGKVDIPAATVDYGLSARVFNRPELMKNATPEELDELTEAVVPLKITGPLASPSVRPDLEKLLRKQVEDELKDKLKDKLKGLFD